MTRNFMLLNYKHPFCLHLANGRKHASDMEKGRKHGCETP